MSTARVLGGAAATIAIARVALTRALRTKMTIGAACIAGLPAVFASALHASHHDDRPGVLALARTTAVVIVALVVAGPIGDELDDRTMTYLWSRPLPRWSVVTGKLAALVPLAALLSAGGVALAFATMPGDHQVATADAIATMIGGAVAMSAIAAALATLVPRQALALTVAYLFFLDLPIAEIPARIQVVSIWFHAGQLGQAGGEGVVAAVIGLAAIAAVWLAVALWRVQRIE